jgi:hypothetical protein
LLTFIARHSPFVTDADNYSLSSLDPRKLKEAAGSSIGLSLSWLGREVRAGSSIGISFLVDFSLIADHPSSDSEHIWSI